MSTIYLISDQGKLTKKGETICLQTDPDTTRTIFPFKTEQLVLVGNIEITSPALKLLMRHRINTVFLNKNGRFNGKLDFEAGKNVLLRRKQFLLLDQKSFRLAFARMVVSAKLKNQLNFMMRIRRSGESDSEISLQIKQVKSLIGKAIDALSLDSLRGLEGAGARAFFGVFRKAIIPDFAVFNGRSMNPPQDNVNAVLSFLYTLIYYRVEAALQVEGLDSYVGYYHRLNYGKCSLAFDLVEEYRTPIADTLTVALFNLGILKEEDFHEVTFSTADTEFPLENTHEQEAAFQSRKGILLTRDGLRKVISQFEKKLETQLFYPPLQRPVSYKQIIREQVKHLKRVIQAEESDYKPLTVK